jgi:hypothetical protein
MRAVDANSAPVLDSRACAALIQLTDMLRHDRDQGAAPLVTLASKFPTASTTSKDIFLLELASLIGAPQQEGLVLLFAASVERITIRRVQAPDQDLVLNFHTDTASLNTMPVALKDESEYDGGRLVCALERMYTLSLRVCVCLCVCLCVCVCRVCAHTR